MKQKKNTQKRELLFYSTAPPLALALFAITRLIEGVGPAPARWRRGAFEPRVHAMHMHVGLRVHVYAYAPDQAVAGSESKFDVSCHSNRTKNGALVVHRMLSSASFSSLQSR